MTQLLLTDQRSPQKKWVDAIYAAIVNEAVEMGNLKLPPHTFATGGVVTGRAPSIMPMMQSCSGHSREHVVISPDIDYAEIEMRMLAAHAGPGATIVVDIEAGADGSCEIPGRPDLVHEIQMMVRRKRDDDTLRAITGKDYTRFDPTKQVTRRRPR